MLSPEIRKGFSGNHKPDLALPWYVSKLVRSHCPKRSTDGLERTLEELQRAISEYER